MPGMEAYPAALGLDMVALDQIVSSAPPGLGAWERWARVWQDLLHGRWQAASDEAAALESEAASAGDAALVIEGAALRALSVAASGDLARALSIARRASRMARTESIPEQEYVAHLVLARIRRLTGHPHLATRIIAALGRVAPPAWHAWLRWELVMAGALEIAAELRDPLPSPGASAAQALACFVMAAEAGDRRAFERARGDLEEAASMPLLAEDVRATLEITDLDGTPANADVLAWCAGASARGPSPLHGLLTRKGSAPLDESAIAYVVAHPDGIRRRIPRLVWAFARVDGVVALPQGRRKQGRVETLVSALALAGDGGLEERACFSEVYGFVYEPEVHKNIFHVLVHRAREWLGEAGTVEVRGGQVTLHLTQPILVPDPRCTKPMQDRLLRVVAERRGATAKDIASALGVSLRVAQSALQDLSADGACLAQREGKLVRYVVEDTTFSEPTQAS